MIRTLRRLTLSILLLGAGAGCTPPATVGAEAGVSVSAEDTTGVQLLNRAAAVRAMDVQYDPLLRDAGVTGTVVLDVLLQGDGSVQEARVVQSTHESFTGSASRMVTMLRFSPPAEAGAVVRVRMQFIPRHGEIEIVR